MAVLENRATVVEKVLANWALEGFQPDVDFLALLDQYVSGEMSLREISALVDAKFGVQGDQ